jgi:hypothetical protein
MPAQYRSPQKLRLELAQQAAKLIAVDGVSDYMTAKRKAALQLGLPVGKYLPTNSEIEQALAAYQHLFQGDSQPRHLGTLRRIAGNAMRLLRDYRPVLVGPVLSGTATRHSHIDLHVFCDEPEQIGFVLEQHGIPHRLTHRTLRHRSDESDDYPVYHFRAEDVPVNLIVLPLNRMHNAPLSPVDGKPMQRAGLDKVVRLLDDQGE